MPKAISLVIGLSVGVLVAAATTSGLAAATSDHAAAFRDRWSATEVAVLASLRLRQLPPTPQDPSNAVDRSRAAAELAWISTDPYSANAAR